MAKQTRSKIRRSPRDNVNTTWDVLRRAAQSRWLAAAVIVPAALVMVAWSWETWPDVLIDFGRELYVPWRISEGEVLYRDLAYFNGPLSPYINSVWFRLFGVSIHVLALANLAILFVLLWLIYALLADIGSRTSALLGSLVFVFLFSCSRYVIAGNYNYICPYSHEMTHGITLSLGALFFLRQFLRSERLRDVGLSGFCLGTVFLTKPEIFVAVLTATVVGLGLALWRGEGTCAARPPWRRCSWRPRLCRPR